MSLFPQLSVFKRTGLISRLYLTHNTKRADIKWARRHNRGDSEALPHNGTARHAAPRHTVSKSTHNFPLCSEIGISAGFSFSLQINFRRKSTENTRQPPAGRLTSGLGRARLIGNVQCLGGRLI